MDEAASAPSTATAHASPANTASAVVPAHDGKEFYLVARAAPEADPGMLKATTEWMTAAASLLWPLIVIAVLYRLRRPLFAAATAIAARIADPNQALKTPWLELEVSKLASQVETNQVENQVLAAAALPQGAAFAPQVASEKPAQPAEAWAELRKLAGQYKATKLPNWAEQVRAKDALAAQMAGLVLTQGISREQLAQDTDEGVRMALATVITTEPKPGDDALISTAGRGITLKHVRYRFMMAVGRLAESGLLTPERAQEFRQLAADYRKGADEPLLRRIQRTLLLLDPIAAPPAAGA